LIILRKDLMELALKDLPKRPFFGEIRPYIPGSIFQILDTQVYISEEIAAPFDCWETVGY